MHIAIDADSFLFKAACACEKRSIVATYKPSGKTKAFDNRTKLKEYLKEINKDREVPFEYSEFEIEDIQTATEAKTAFGIFKGLVEQTLGKAGYNEFADTYALYFGSGETFRHKQATILKYKGNRDNLIQPILLPNVKRYALKNFNCEVIKGIEADDAVQIKGVQGYIQWKQTNDPDDKVIVVSIDKDAKRGPGWLLNPDKDESPRLIEGFGKLFLSAKGKPDGEGRVWGYYQLLAGDAIDNYAANSASSKKYAGKSAYKALMHCKTDEEALRVVVEQYKMLYPEPKTIEGWRGDAIEIDWLYVLQENAMLSIMQTEEGEEFSMEKILKHYGVLDA